MSKNSDGGYTLVETLVAMSLFVGVLLPLVGIIATVSLDDKSAKIHQALSLAESEITMVSAGKDYSNRTKAAEGGFIIDRKVTTSRGLAEIDVTVTRKEKQLLHLCKIVLMP